MERNIGDKKPFIRPTTVALANYSISLQTMRKYNLMSMGFLQSFPSLRICNANRDDSSANFVILAKPDRSEKF
jgi:hypothetical protein